MLDSSPSKSRPLGITVLSVLLGWLAIAGFGNAIAWNLPSVRAMLSQLPTAVSNAMPDGLLFATLALAYGATATASCVGLWRMRPWAPQAYLAWCIVLLVLGVYLSLLSFGLFLIAGLAFAVGMAGFAALAYPYISRRISGHVL
jgi:uncharacterized membrane protein (DUF2068 family)